MKEINNDGKQNIFAKWIKRFGFAGFMFFFLKGLILYIILPVVLIWLGYSWE